MWQFCKGIYCNQVTPRSCFNVKAIDDSNDFFLGEDSDRGNNNLECCIEILECPLRYI